MLRISLSVSLYLKTWWYPSPSGFFFPTADKNPNLTERLLSQTLLRSKARCPDQSVYIVGISSMVGWGVRRMMVMMMEPPSFCLAKDKYMCPPQKKTHTHVFGYLLGWKNNCVYAQSCTPTWRTREVSWGVLMFFFDAMTHETIGFHAFGDLAGTELNKRTNKCIYKKASWTGKCPWVYKTTYLQNDPNPAMSRTNHILKQISTKLAPPRYKWINPYKYRDTTGVTHLYISR